MLWSSSLSHQSHPPHQKPKGGSPGWRRVLTSGLCLLTLWSAQAAQAATFTVTKTADTADGACNTDCSLREAITAANSAAGNDIITFKAATFGSSAQTINLDSEL